MHVYRLSNYFVWFLYFILFVYIQGAYAADVTIKGTIHKNTTTAKTIVQIVKPGFPFQGATPSDVSWVLLGEGYANDVDGTYTLTVNATGVVLVLAYYEKTNYSIMSLVDLTTQTLIEGIDLTLPFFDINNISMDIKVFEGAENNEVEINYRQRQYQLLIIADAQATDKRIVDITSLDYKFNKNNKVFDLPDGKYKVICALNLKNDAGFKYVTTDVTLPLPDNNKVHNIYFR